MNSVTARRHFLKLQLGSVRHAVIGASVLCACACFVAPARAAYIYQLTDAAGVQQNDFVIANIGQTVDVGVWLKQIDPDTALTDEGLFSAGVKLTYSAPGIAEVSSPSDITPNPAFDDPAALLKDIGSDYVTLDMATDISGPNFPIFPELSTPDRIWLGMFKFTGLSLGSVQITATDSPDLDNTLTGLGTVLDAGIGSAEGSVNVVDAVPEPSALALLAGLALIVVPYITWRRTAT